MIIAMFHFAAESFDPVLTSQPEQNGAFGRSAKSSGIICAFSLCFEGTRQPQNLKDTFLIFIVDQSPNI